MTAGIAIASWKDDNPQVVVAADTRLSRDSSVLNDSSVKTLEIASRTAMVFAGPTTPGFVAAELVRTIVRTHRARQGSRRLGFLDIARLVCHFQYQAAVGVGKAGETVVVGFYRSGTPGLAQVRVDEEGGQVAYFKCARGGVIALSVGVPEAKTLLLRGLETAKQEQRPLTMAAVSMLKYMSRHEGDPFVSVGGQISLGWCTPKDDEFSWPALEIAGRRYWRGIDLTPSWPSTWPEPLVINYDENWCAQVDQNAAPLPAPGQGVPANGQVPYIDIEGVPLDLLFTIRDDPPGY